MKTDSPRATRDKPRVICPDVFGNELGERIGWIKTAWNSTVRKTGISGLRFHDLRHEAGSRFLEGGMPLHVGQQLLGHADVRTTSIYLNATRLGLHESMRRFDESRKDSQEFASWEDSSPSGTFVQDDNEDAKLLKWQGIETGAGDGDRTRDQRLGKP